MSFRVALTGDFYNDSGQPKFKSMGLDIVESRADIFVSRFAEHRPTVGSDQVEENNGLIVLTPAVTKASVERSDNLLVLARFGVGFDAVDVQACTDADVLVTITAGAVDRPVAEATVGWMIALTHRFIAKDRIVRQGNWDDRVRYMGCELRDRTLGIIGFGGIGRALVTLLRGFGMRPPIAFDPYVSTEVMSNEGVRAVSLDDLLSTADFVSVHCPLASDTRGLLGIRELSLMKRDAYILNTARGGIVDEDALFEMLSQNRIAGAALDCFEVEPVTAPHRFGTLENVILAPHSVAWTDELFRDIGRTAWRSIIELTSGRRPKQGVVNPELFERESFRKKWRRIAQVETQ